MTCWHLWKLVVVFVANLLRSYVHLGFRAPPSLVNPHRVAIAWAILRLRHPLLAARVVMEPGEYDTARFVWV